MEKVGILKIGYNHFYQTRAKVFERRRRKRRGRLQVSRHWAGKEAGEEGSGCSGDTTPSSR